MPVNILRFPGESSVEELASRIVGILNTPGAVLLVPTETVYGLICRADDSTACLRIYELKKRPENKRTGWFVRCWQELEKYGVTVSGPAQKLFETFSPGPLTLILPSEKSGTQGVRIPDHPLLLSVLEKLDCPLIQTSANASGMADVLTVQEALEQLAGSVDLAIDGGVLTPGSRGSTVALVDGNTVKVLRAGEITGNMLENALKNHHV